jgi:hypothetical protein
VTAGDALHHQIEASIRQRIRSGALPAGLALPPTRALAAELGVTRGVVVEAYGQLVAEGYLTSRSGGYTQVASAAAAAPPAAPPRPERPAPPRSARPVVDFGYGRSNLAAFPRAAWLRSVRRVLTEAAGERLGYLGIALPAVPGAAWRPHLRVLEPQRVSDHRRHHPPGPGRFEPPRVHDHRTPDIWQAATSCPLKNGSNNPGSHPARLLDRSIFYDLRSPRLSHEWGR